LSAGASTSVSTCSASRRLSVTKSHAVAMASGKSSGSRPAARRWLSSRTRGLARLGWRCVVGRGEPAIGHCRHRGESSIGPPTAEPDLRDPVGYRGEQGLGGVVLRRAVGSPRTSDRISRSASSNRAHLCAKGMPTARWSPGSCHRPRSWRWRGPSGHRAIEPSSQGSWPSPKSANGR
jgi:hypothetical protein